MLRHDDENGFTMIEIAIVLIIIGIIIGAVVKGKDLISSAEQKKIYTKFISAWNNAYLTFYDRTGRVLGDTVDNTSNAAVLDGWADTRGGNAGINNAALCDSTAGTGAFYGLAQVGIDCPTTNTSTDYQYNYKDSDGNTQTLTIAFLANTPGAGGSNYNYMEIQGITTELGMAIDTMIDGQADGQNGDFMCFDATPALQAWGTNPTGLVTARWKMQF